jgi:TM2 domain-containing membrane protein YozV
MHAGSLNDQGIRGGIMAEFKNREEYEQWKADRAKQVPQAKVSSSPAVKTTKEKSLPLAIGLNFLFPGVGYFYMGRISSGIFAVVLTFLLGFMMVISPESIGIVASFFPGMQIVMIIDMLLLQDKRKKAIETNTLMPCPSCAEMIKKEAKVCRFCSREVQT